MSEHRASGTPPYTTLGTRLKYLREQHNESLGEVSGAVEIDIEKLQRIEQGTERPSEDILVLLINHFGMQGSEALRLWELAGYDGDAPESLTPPSEVSISGKPVMVLMAMEARTAYTDGVEAVANQAGVTVEFTQAGAQGQAASVAKLGMSCEQAENVIKTLQSALLKAKYSGGHRALPASTEGSKKISRTKN